MKNALVRLLTIATLAASFSTFAAAETKHSSSPNASVDTQQAGCAENAKHEKKQKKAKKTQDDDQKDRDYDRSLLGNYG